MQKERPTLNELRKLAKKGTKPFDPSYAAKTKARIAHVCDFCEGEIAPGETYYQEGKERPLGTLHGRKLCSNCHEELSTA